MLESQQPEHKVRDLSSVNSPEEIVKRQRQEDERIRALRHAVSAGDPQMVQMALNAEVHKYHPGVLMKQFKDGKQLSPKEAIAEWREDIVREQQLTEPEDLKFVDDMIGKVKRELGLEEVTARVDYKNMSPEERVLFVRATVEGNKGQLRLQELSGAGYLGYNVLSPDKVAVENNINQIQADIGKKFIDEILTKLSKYSVNPAAQYGADRWQAKYRQAPDELIGYLRQNYGGFTEAFDFGKDSAAVQFLDTKFNAATEEFKIHLQPKKERVPEVLEELVKLAAQDESFSRSIQQFKVALNNDTGHEVYPEIVIYPNLGKAEYLKALKVIIEKFKGREDALGSGEVPRKNNNLSKLVNVAQSGGDFKKMLDNLGLLDKYFDKTRNHGIALTTV